MNASFFMLSRRKLRGQHINSCSRVIHRAMSAGKLAGFCPIKSGQKYFLSGQERVSLESVLKTSAPATNQKVTNNNINLYFVLYVDSDKTI